MTIPLVITDIIKFSGKISLRIIPVSNLWIFLLFTKTFVIVYNNNNLFRLF